jgi:TonB family protein
MGIRSKIDNRRSVIVCACCATIAAAFVSTAGFAQQRPGIIHFIDTNTDRVPALTAFPKYPSVARRDRIEGEATVCFKIKANGKISRPVVTERSHKIFSKPALRAIKKSNFEPIGPGQILATARTCRIYRFRLDPILVKADDPK